MSGLQAETRGLLVEEYRPNKVSQMIGQDHIKPKLEEYVEKEELPHLMFAGGPGVGKTTAAIAMAKEIYGDGWTDHFLELNASDERGIDVVRERIKEFAMSGYDTRQRIIFLDEADNLTDDAQNALRRTIERFSADCRFILSCNYSAQVIEPIQSRCAVFNFQPVPDDDLEGHLGRVVDAEDMEVTDGAVEAVVRYANGDVRKAVNTLDALYVDEQLTEEDVVSALPIADREDVLEMLRLCTDGEFDKALAVADELMKEKGVMARHIIQEIHDIVWDLDADDDIKVEILNEAGNREFYINEGSTERVQIGALLGAVVKEVRK